MTDGIIQLGSARADALGFTADKFSSGSYIWKSGNTVSISFIASKEKGAFRALVQTILARGWEVHVPIPMGRMRDIVRKNGYVKTLVPFFMPGEKHDLTDNELIDVWVLKPKSPSAITESPVNPI